MTGTTLGTWTLGTEIGRGPLGVTYRATSTAGPSRTAAVKVLTAEFALKSEFLIRFPGEMLPLQQLVHPNIARFYDSGTHAGVGYIASEFIDGIDLATRIKSTKRDDPGLSWQDAVLGLAAQVSRALKHGHHRSTLHRDLKPSNVIVMADGTVKLSDFGISKVLNRPPMTIPPDPFGTAGFLAPEYFTGKQLTRRSDLYSLGCVLYFAVTGRPPYTGNSIAEFMHKHCYVLPDRPSQFAPKIPADLDDLICTLLNKDPSRRPATAAVVLAALDHIRGRAERKGEKVAWPTTTDPELEPEPHADGGFNAATRPRPLMSRPAVVIPLFLLLVAVAAALYFWPRPTAEELFARARPLIETDDPLQWEQAMTDYLGPLSDRYPDQYADEIKVVRGKLRDHRTQRRAMEDGLQTGPRSEAERLYQRGLALLQSGDPAAADRIWTGLAKAFAGDPAQERWVKLATVGATAVGGKGKVLDESRVNAITALVEQISQKADAKVALDALEEAYRDDPPALELVRQVRGK